MGSTPTPSLALKWGGVHLYFLGGIDEWLVTKSRDGVKLVVESV